MLEQQLAALRPSLRTQVLHVVTDSNPLQVNTPTCDCGKFPAPDVAFTEAEASFPPPPSEEGINAYIPNQY